MPIPLLDSVEFNKIPSLQFSVPLVTADPAGYTSGLIFNTSELALKFWNGTAWKTVLVLGDAAPPTGIAGGDLDGAYPNPAIKAGVIVDSDVNTTAAIQQSKILNLVTDLAGKASTASLSSYQLLSGKGVAGGYAPLDGSNLIPTAHLPPLAISEVFVVASEAAMLALSAQTGDMAIRTDLNKTFVLSASPASTLTNWIEVMAAGQVLSVNGKTGVVTITLAELGGVPTTRSVIAGNGLTGGGTLAADAILNVVGDANLSVGADLISVLSAPKWQTARTLSLTGDVTGTATIDGSANITIATTAVAGGAKRFTQDLGAITGGTPLVVTHNLNTRDLHVSIYKIAASADQYSVAQCGILMDTVNSVKLTFAQAYPAATYRVVILG